MRFCPKCGKEIKKSKNFCSKCGKDIHTRSKKHRKLSYIYLIAFIILIFIIFFSVFNVNNGSNRSVENSFFNLFNQQASEDSYCGDGTCRNEETCKNCIKDCGDCRETNYY